MTKLPALLLLLPIAAAMASEFLPMTPIGADCIPVTIRVTGDRDLAVTAAEQLGDDIDFSGLLMTAPEGEGYAEADVEVRNVSGGVELVAEVSSGGERLLSRSYTGSSVYTLVHAFADDLVFDLTGEEGIAYELRSRKENPVPMVAWRPSDNDDVQEVLREVYERFGLTRKPVRMVVRDPIEKGILIQLLMDEKIPYRSVHLKSAGEWAIEFDWQFFDRVNALKKKALETKYRQSRKGASPPGG